MLETAFTDVDNRIIRAGRRDRATPTGRRNRSGARPKELDCTSNPTWTQRKQCNIAIMTAELCGFVRARNRPCSSPRLERHHKTVDAAQEREKEREKHGKSGLHDEVEIEQRKSREWS